MSFASETRKELTKTASDGRKTAESELCAALLCLGAISFRGKGRYRISFTVDSASVIRYFFSQLKNLFGIVCEIRTIRVLQLRHRLRYRLVIPDDDCAKLLKALDLTDERSLFGVRLEAPEVALDGADRCNAFLRGAFMVCGSITDPGKSYHMEFAPGSEQVADNIIDALRKLEINANKACRKSQYVVYLKNSENIVELLAHIGAFSAMMKTEDIRIQKNMVNGVQRQVNCEMGNLNRMMKSSENQQKDILYIFDQLGSDALPASLRELAEKRLEYPNETLAELGELLTPPIGKSGVNNRMRKLTTIAAKLRSGEEVNL